MSDTNGPSSTLTPQQLKRELKQLTNDKKILSRQIGDARKQGQDASDLITQVKQLSQSIDATKKRLAQCKTPEAESSPILTPPQMAPFEPRDSEAAQIIELSKQTETLWTEYVSQHPNASVYHTLETREVISQTFGHELRYFLAITSDGKACGVLPLCRLKSRLFGDFWCSLPFFNYGGVLADNSSVAEQLQREAASLLKFNGSSHIEYRHCRDDQKKPSRTDKVSMVLQLPPNSDALWQAIGSKLRAQIKKAQSHNLTFKHGREELIDDFYAVFAHNMRDLGTPVYPKELFRVMLDQHESANITAAYYRGKPVSAGFTLGWRNTVEIPWASTLREANQYNANMLLYWEILKHSTERGYQLFDFGRSSADANTYRFKKQWGATPKQLYWHYELPEGEALPALNPNNPKYRLMINTWQKLPVWLTKVIGPAVVKYLP